MSEQVNENTITSTGAGIHDGKEPEQTQILQPRSITVHSAKYFGVNPNQVVASVTVDGMNDGNPFGYFVGLDRDGDTDIACAVIESIKSGKITVASTDTDLTAYNAQVVRETRNRLLSDTDYLVNADYPITDEQRAEIVAYRQALRDITQQEGFPDNVVWPVKPAFVK